jgi:hypothetical protein
MYDLSTLMSEAAEFSVKPTRLYQATWHHIPEDSKLQISSRFSTVLYVVCNPL